MAFTAVVLVACVAGLGCASGGPRQAPSLAATCGDGTIGPDETCVSCPADCPSTPCAAGGEEATFTVQLSVPIGDSATSVTTRIGYDETLMRFPGSGLTADTQKRIQKRPKGASTFANALEHAVRVVQTKNDGLPSGAIYSISLDHCKGARSATASDLTCTVEGCAGKFGLIERCSCSVVPAGVDVSDVGTKEN